jgi:hypothetical protein
MASKAPTKDNPGGNNKQKSIGNYLTYKNEETKLRTILFPPDDIPTTAREHLNKLKLYVSQFSLGRISRARQLLRQIINERYRQRSYVEKNTALLEITQHVQDGHQYWINNLREIDTVLADPQGKSREYPEQTISALSNSLNNTHIINNKSTEDLSHLDVTLSEKTSSKASASGEEHISDSVEPIKDAEDFIFGCSMILFVDSLPTWFDAICNPWEQLECSSNTIADIAATTLSDISS